MIYSLITIFLIDINLNFSFLVRRGHSSFFSDSAWREQSATHNMKDTFMRLIPSVFPSLRLPAAMRSFAFAALFATAAGFTPQASAAVLVGNGAGPRATDNFVYDDQGYGVWFVADLTDPITPAPLEIEPDSASGPWTWNLTFAPGAPDLNPGDSFIINANLTLDAGDFALGGTTLLIQTPGWKWTDAAAFDYDTSFSLDGESVNVSDSFVSISFDPLATGRTIVLIASLEYTGDAGPASPLSVNFAAVPEPSTTGLVLLWTVAGMFSVSRLRRAGRSLSPASARGPVSTHSPLHPKP
jgi:hypothetical protein